MRIIGALLVGCLVLAGCGSSGSVVRGGSTGAGSSSAAASSAPPSSTPPSTPSTSATSARAGVHPELVVTPSRALAARQVVSVKATGFSPGEALQVVQCAAKLTATGPADCNLSGMQSVVSDTAGSVSVRFTVLRGPFGANHIVCGPSQACLVSVTQATLAPTEEADVIITFAKR